MDTKGNKTNKTRSINKSIKSIRKSPRKSIKNQYHFGVRTFLKGAKGAVLHVVYPKTSGATQKERHETFISKGYTSARIKSVVDEVKRASARYEGPNVFVGFNFPASFVTKREPILYSKLTPDTQ